MALWHAIAICALSTVLPAQQPAARTATQEGETPVFGTTVVIPFGLKGDIYHLTSDVYQLPKLEKLEPVGSVYTKMLNIPPTNFAAGFPGVTKRDEWFAIDYRGRFYISRPGRYDFTLISDDGSRLYIDDKLLIDNDGLHPPATMTGSVKLVGGVHRIRVSYFQGPGHQLALILAVTGPGDKQPHIFSTDDYKPPVNPADWKYGSPDDLKEPEKPAPAPEEPRKKKKRNQR